jgi:hypothetical protein
VTVFGPYPFPLPPVCIYGIPNMCRFHQKKYKLELHYEEYGRRNQREKDKIIEKKKYCNYLKT